MPTPQPQPEPQPEPRPSRREPMTPGQRQIFANDCFELGIAYFDLGRWEPARRWLAGAERYGHPEAAERLQRIDALIEDVCDADYLGAQIDHLLTQMGAGE